MVNQTETTGPDDDYLGPELLRIAKQTVAKDIADLRAAAPQMPAMPQTIRDQFWRGAPEPVQAWAALTREGNLMPFSVRERPEDVRLACGECVPVRVLITYVAEPNE